MFKYSIKNPRFPVSVIFIIFIYISTSIYIYLFIYLLVYMSVLPPSLSIYLYITFFFHISSILHLFLLPYFISLRILRLVVLYSRFELQNFLYYFFYLYLYVYLHLFIYLSVFLFVYLFRYPYVFISIYYITLSLLTSNVHLFHYTTGSISLRMRAPPFRVFSDRT